MYNYIWKNELVCLNTHVKMNTKIRLIKDNKSVQKIVKNDKVMQ